MFDFDALDDITPTAPPAPVPAVHSHEPPPAPVPAVHSSEDTEQEVNAVADEAVSTLEDASATVEEHICDNCGQITADGQFGSDPQEWYCSACVQSMGADAHKPGQQENDADDDEYKDLPDLIDPDAPAEDASGPVDQVPAPAPVAADVSSTPAPSTGAFTAAVNATSSTASATSGRSWTPAAIGECYETVGKVLMREGELLSSRLVGSLPVGTIMEVLEVSMSENSRRIRVIEEHGVEGWVSLAKESGEQLLQRREADVEDRVMLEKAKIEAKGNKPKPGATSKTSYSSSVCDKCDGPHPTDKCPFFKKAREDHKDAWANYGPNAQKSLKLGGGGGNYFLKSARVVRQPGDGSCLFHSMSFGLTGGRSSYHQREELAAFIEANPNRKIAGDTIEEWVRWDANISSTQYARRIAHSGWGGGIEMACCSILKNANVHVYETTKNAQFKRISCFDVPRPSRTIHVLYQGGVHYDALIPAY